LYISFGGGSNVKLDVDEVEDYSGYFPGKVFNVFYSGCTAVSVVSDVGQITKLEGNVPEEKEETLQFVYEKTKSLDFHPIGTVEEIYSSMDHSFSMDGRVVSFPVPVFGIVKVRYTTSADKYGFDFTASEKLCLNDKPPAALIVFQCSDQRSTKTVSNWYCNRKTITARIVDACTGDPVPNANITVDGVDKGQADESGLITLHDMVEGDHNIKITADGYVDSDADTLANDTFTVTYDADELD